MTESDSIELVSYMLGSFAVGYGIGLLTVSFKKSFDLL